jgi:hypothetical protein
MSPLLTSLTPARTRGFVAGAPVTTESGRYGVVGQGAGMKRSTYDDDSVRRPYGTPGPLARDTMARSTCGQPAEGREGAAAFVLGDVAAAAQVCQ